MNKKESFLSTIKSGYAFKGEAVKIGVGMLDGEVIEGTEIYLPLKTLNRHGLIAGATGTGKTKSIQVISECLSDAGIPVAMLDIKGDFSGIAASGTMNDKIAERIASMGLEFHPAAYPVELLVLGEEKGVRLRATVSEFGPILLSKILGLNDTQAGLVAVVFKYCDDNGLPLLDLKDFMKVLQYVSDEGRREIEKTYGKISTTSTATILRKVIELQQQGADAFFGERSFEINDLVRCTNQGKGIITIVRVNDMQDRPKLFSTFMLQLLAELYATFPEAGDLDKPKLVMFIDEAHLIFQEASSALLQQIETIVKLIRSKGIGVFFCTQNPTDIPADVLAQLGLKFQHALRAFTAADRKNIKRIAENYPESEFYSTDDLITKLGIGEALITMLNEKGIPTPLVHALIRPPQSRMDILSPGEIDNIVSSSSLVAKYNTPIDSVSAYEILKEKMESASAAQENNDERKNKPREKGILDHPMVKQMGRTAASVITRTLLGVLGFKRRR